MVDWLIKFLEVKYFLYGLLFRIIFAHLQSIAFLNDIGGSNAKRILGTLFPELDLSIGSTD